MLVLDFSFSTSALVINFWMPSWCFQVVNIVHQTAILHNGKACPGCLKLV
jgi:hypothetical protein